MTDIMLIEGKLIDYEKGDIFTIKSENGNRFNFWFGPEVSPERTALIDAMFNGSNVKVVVTIEDKADSRAICRQCQNLTPMGVCGVALLPPERLKECAIGKWVDRSMEDEGVNE